MKNPFKNRRLLITPLLLGVFAACSSDRSQPEPVAHTSKALESFRFRHASADAWGVNAHHAVWNGTLRMASFIKLRKFTVELPGSAPFQDAWFVNDDRSLSKIVVNSNGDNKGSLTFRIDGTTSLSLDLDDDGTVDIQETTSPGGRREVTLSEGFGRTAWALWEAGRNPLCVGGAITSNELIRDSGLIAGCYRNSEDSGVEGGFGNEAPTGGWGNISDPLDILCAGVNTATGVLASDPTQAQATAEREGRRADAQRLIDLMARLADQLRESVEEHAEASPYRPDRIVVPDKAQQMLIEHARNAPPLPPPPPPGSGTGGSTSGTGGSTSGTGGSTSGTGGDGTGGSGSGGAPSGTGGSTGGGSESRPGNPEDVTIGLLAQLCQNREERRPSERERYREALRPRCPDIAENPAYAKAYAAAVGIPAGDCFGSDTETYESLGALISAATSDECGDTNEKEHGCEPNLDEKLRKMTKWAMLGNLQGIELCDPLVCSPLLDGVTAFNKLDETLETP